MFLNYILDSVTRQKTQEKFETNEIEIEVNDCFETSCEVNHNLDQTILNGTTITCDGSHVGVITKSKLLFYK